MAVSIRTLSQLPEISSNGFPENAYLETSVPIDVSMDDDSNVTYSYASRKIKNGELKKNVNAEVRRILRNDTGIPTDDSKNFGKMYDDYGKLIAEDFVLSGTKTFVENPILLQDQISDFNTDINYSVSLSALKRYTNQNAAPAIGSEYGFVSRLSNDSGGSEIGGRLVSLFAIDSERKIVEKVPSYVFSPDSAKFISENEYIFRISPEERSSNSWVAPASGIFTCYGWLDEINNDRVSNENRWVALLGYQSQLGVWTTLQVQPFIKNNYLSYVGFTFPVHKGMMLKIQTGFAVGSNSDKYFRSSSSLANHIPNAFLGGIYTGLSVDFDNLDGNYETIENQTLLKLSNDLCAALSHELTCDDDFDRRLDELEDKVATNATIAYLSSEIDKRVKYIDAGRYTGSNAKSNPSIRRATINWGNGKNLSKGGAVGIFASGVKQYSYIEGEGYDSNGYTVRRVDWSVSPGGSILHSLPNRTEKEDGQTIFHRDAAVEEIAPGTIFTDGKYAYYKVSQDSTVLIRLSRDPSNHGHEGIQCWLMYKQDRMKSYLDNSVISLGTCLDQYSGTGELTEISLPLKKGSILVFGMYKRERPENYSVSDIMWQPINIYSPLVASFDALLNSDSFSSQESTFEGTKNGTTLSQKLTTYRLNVDFSTSADVYSDSDTAVSKKFSWKNLSADFHAGKIAEIAELP